MIDSSPKVLSVVIPTFNMERYLAQCLDSLTTIENIDDVEVLVVNDGSTDGSLEIALSYEAGFPGSVSVIDKANGHYGSCVNAGLAKARGKYIKVLDSDDWVDSAAFQRLVADLRACDADLVISDYVKCYDDGHGERERVSSGLGRRKILSVADLTEISIGLLPLFHAFVTYKTSMLRAINYRQMERSLYTDLIWTSIPMQSVSSVVAFDYPVYQYRLGRQGQSVSADVRAMHFDDEFAVRIEILKKLESAPFLTEENRRLCDKIIYRLLSIVYRDVLVKGAVPDVSCLRRFDAQVMEVSPSLWRRMNRLMVSDAIFVPYVWLWRNGHNHLLRASVSLRNLFHHQHC